MRPDPPKSTEIAGTPPLPSMPAALARAIRFAYRAEPRLLVAALALGIGAFIPDGLAALWLRLLAQGVTGGNSDGVRNAAIGLALSGVAGWLLRTAGGRVQNRFRDRVTVALETHVADIQASIVSIEHHERPEHLDRLQLLRDHAFLLNHLFDSFIATMGSVARLIVTVGLLVSVDPLLVLMAVAALPTVWVSSWRAGIERKTEEAAASDFRRSRHFFELATQAGAGKELRAGRVEAAVLVGRDESWGKWFARVSRQRFVSALWHTAVWSLFGLAYVAAVVFVADVRNGGPGDVLLVLAAGGSLSRYLAVTVSQAQFLRWTIEAAQRLTWLEDYATSRRDGAELQAPDLLREGIRFDGVSFRYPGTDPLVLEDVNLMLPAGAVVAVVGENGAGKSTLVKLLCRFYEPTVGSISVDGIRLSDIEAKSWRERLGGAFQDFFQFEFLARRTVGLGDLARIEDSGAVDTAVERGGASDVVERLRDGLDTQLGPTWHEGEQLSFGQWQKLSVARGFMRDRPLLCVLDEPTAALDAETEHALFERFAAASRSSANDGRITVLVSHRFSTVRMADLIVVLDGNQVAEFGPHESLMANNGLYAELYGIQASAYR